MKITQAKTYEAKLYCGLKEGYEGPVHTVDEVYEVCKSYCDMFGFCVTVTPTQFVYKNGDEDGAIIGIINYPRFPATKRELKKHIEVIVKILLDKFKQNRISVVYPDKTVMYEN